MLREGLAAEFPFAKRAADRVIAAIRGGRVSREAPLWAAISAFGAAWMVSAIAAALAGGFRLAGARDPASWLSGAFAIVGYAIAAAIALRAGGRRGLAWYAALLAVGIGINIATALPGYLLFCDRSGGAACSVVQFVGQYVYLVVGLALSPAAVLMIRSGAPGRNVFLNGAGVFSLASSLIVLVYLVVRPADVVAASAMHLVAGGSAAFVAGAALRARSPRLVPAALVAATMALGWAAFSAPSIAAVLRDGAGSQPVSVYVSGLTDALAVGLGWIAASAFQRARTTAAA